jgi:hypothetical protein
VKRRSGRRLPVAISLIDVACGAFGGLLLLALVLIRVAPPEAGASPSGVLTVQLRTLVSAEDYDGLLQTQLWIDDHCLFPSASGGSADKAGNMQVVHTSSCGRPVTVRTSHRIGQRGEYLREYRVSLEAIKRPLSVRLEVRQRNASSGTVRTLPRYISVTVAGTAFSKALRDDVRRVEAAADGGLALGDRLDNSLRIRIDPTVRYVRAFLTSEHRP